MEASDASNIPMAYTQVPAVGWEGDSTSGKSCAPAPMNIKRQGRTMINIKGSRKPSHQLLDVKCCAFTRRGIGGLRWCDSQAQQCSRHAFSPYLIGRRQRNKECPDPQAIDSNCKPMEG